MDWHLIWFFFTVGLTAGILGGIILYIYFGGMDK